MEWFSTENKYEGMGFAVYLNGLYLNLTENFTYFSDGINIRAGRLKSALCLLAENQTASSNSNPNRVSFCEI